LGGVTLWAGFPKAFAVILPALYMPIIVLLLALIFRGVAFEFRWVAKPHHRKWDISFATGSILAAFAQGVILGGILQEIQVKGNQFAGSPLDLAYPVQLDVRRRCGCGVCIARFHCIGKPMDPASDRAYCRPLVQHSEYLFSVASAGCDAFGFLAMLAWHPAQLVNTAVCIGGWPILSRVCRADDLQHALSGAAIDDDMAGGVSSIVTDVLFDRRVYFVADDSCLHRAGVLAFSRQDRAGRRVSLSSHAKETVNL